MTMISPRASGTQESEFLKELEDEAIEEIQSREPDIWHGSYSNVWLFGEYALKKPSLVYYPPTVINGEFRKKFDMGVVKHNLKLRSKRRLIREMMIAELFRRAGGTAPIIYGVSDGAGQTSPFMVMQRLDLIGYSSLPPRNQKKYSDDYEQQVKLAKNAGLIIKDSYKHHNAGIDRITREVYLFDFDRWSRKRKTNWAAKGYERVGLELGAHIKQYVLENYINECNGKDVPVISPDEARRLIEIEKRGELYIELSEMGQRGSMNHQPWLVREAIRDFFEQGKCKEFEHELEAGK